MKNVTSKFKGQGLVQKALRGSVVSILGFGGQQFLRLLSNIALAYLLFPEAFGVMALVTVFLTGLQQFSDVGITQSIVQSERGDEPVFLNTAWTIQIARGFLLWAIATALAWPMAKFYNQPILIEIMPICALSVLIQGFVSTKIETAKRHLEFTRITFLDLASQVVGLLLTILLAYTLRSIWALVIGSVVSVFAKVVVVHFFMPGHRDRIAFERPAAVEIIHFGKWLFLATIANFLLLNADKFLIGRYVAIEMLGIYNIGFFLASFPLMMTRVVNMQVLVPFYRKSHPSTNRQLFIRARKLQLLTAGSMISLIILLMLVGDLLVSLLYDDRYRQAGIILVALTAMNIPQIAFMPYDQSILSTGRSRWYFYMMGFKAFIYVGCVWIGLEQAGLLGAIIGQGLAFVISYPFIAWMAVRAKVWDPVYDLIMIAITVAVWSISWLLFSNQMMSLTVI